MQPPLSFYETFIRRSEKIYKNRMSAYLKSISNASDSGKILVHSETVSEVLEGYQKVQKELNINSRLLIEVDDECKKDKSKLCSEIFDKKIRSIESEEHKTLLNNLSLMRALDRFITFLSEERSKYFDISLDSKIHKSNIQWHGGELELVQLIYSLKEAGYISNKEGITASVKCIAELLNFRLGNNWPSNLSENIHARNSDYIPEIFEKLIKGFNSYRRSRTEKKENNTPK